MDHEPERLRSVPTIDLLVGHIRVQRLKLRFDVCRCLSDRANGSHFGLCLGSLQQKSCRLVGWCFSQAPSLRSQVHSYLRSVSPCSVWLFWSMSDAVSSGDVGQDVYQVVELEHMSSDVGPLVCRDGLS